MEALTYEDNTNKKTLLKTEKGVEYFLYSLYIMLVFGILSAISGIMALYGTNVNYNHTAMQNNTTAGMGAMSGAGGALLAIGCGVTLLMIIYAVLLILGVIHFNSGKKEFGEKHSSAVSKGVISFILVIFSVIAGFVIISMMISSIMVATINQNEGQIWPIIREYGIVLSIVLSFFLYTFLGLTYTMMIRETCPSDKRKFLYLGLAFFVIAGIIGVLATYFFLPVHLEGTLEEVSRYSSNARNVSNIGSLASFVGILFFIVPYKSLLEQIRNSEISHNRRATSENSMQNHFDDETPPPSY